MRQLGQATPRLLCSLVHKFGRKDVDDFDAFIKELEAQPSQTVGEVFVFVDECHRTQSGKLHRVMKAMMPNAVFIGFTGTPLLEEGQGHQPGGLRRLHPHLQIQRGGGGRGGARSDLRGAGHRPASRLRGKDRCVVRGQDQGAQRLAEGRTEEAVGHDAERAQLQIPHGSGGRRHHLRLQREAAPFQRARQRHPGGFEHLRGVQVFHAVPEDAVQGQSARW